MTINERSVEPIEDLSQSLIDRLMFILMQNDTPNLQEIKTRFMMVLNDFQISPKETALVVYTEGKNEYFIKKFLLAKAVAGCAKSTLRTYGKEITRVLASIGKDADAITSEDVQIHLAQIMTQSSKSYADTVRRYLSSFYGYLIREELITRNPMAKVDKIKLVKKKKDAFSELEVELIRNACNTNRERAIIELLMSTGCRISELTSIRRDDVEEGSPPKVNILGKGGKYRYVFLNAKAIVAVHNYLAERKDPNPYLFPKCSTHPGDTSEKNVKMKEVLADWYKYPELVTPNEPADKSPIEATLRKIGKRAGVEKVHPHRFRRTCATFALRRGMPIEQVSRMLGHANIATTQIYLDLSDDELAQAHKKYVV